MKIEIKYFLIGFLPMMLFLVLALLLTTFPKTLIILLYIFVAFLYITVCRSLGKLIVDSGIIERLKKKVNK